MKQLKFWMLAAITTLCGATMFTSCSNEDNPSTPQNGQGQTSEAHYYTLFNEGKVWNYTAHLSTGDLPFSIEVKGDTVVEGEACKKLYLQTTQGAWLYGCCYETNYWVRGWQISEFSVDNGLWTVREIQNPNKRTLYVFPVATEWVWNGYLSYEYESRLVNQPDSRWCIKDMEDVGKTYFNQNPIMVRNRLFNRMDLGNGEISELWVSGIGSRHWGVLEPDHEGRLDWLEFESCEENGKVIFTKGDFDAVPLEMDYRPLVEDNKTWLCQGYKGGDVLKEDGYYLYFCYLKGDTIVGGHQCLKMFSQNRRNDGETAYEGAFFEEGRRVYCYFPDKEEARLMYDFSLDNGEEATLFLNDEYKKTLRKVANTYQMYDGRPLHVTVLHESDFWMACWLDGVGVVDRFCVLEPYGFAAIGGFYGAGVIECSVNGKIIYRSPE